MTDPRMERLERHLDRLKLASTKARLDTLLEEGARAQLSFLDFLDKVVGDEVAAKDAKRAIMRTQMARFPLDRTLESFDFDYQPSLDRRLIAELETGGQVDVQEWIATGRPGQSDLVDAPPFGGTERRQKSQGGKEVAGHHATSEGTTGAPDARGALFQRCGAGHRQHIVERLCRLHYRILFRYRNGQHANIGVIGQRQGTGIRR